MRRTRSFLGVSIVSAAVALPCRAQCLAWQNGYAAPGVDNFVFSYATFDDGHGPALYAGGRFTYAGGETASHVARWDGQHWSALGAGVNGDVYALAAFDDGSGPALYAAGTFDTAGGGSALHLARWNGTSWSDVAGGTDANAYSLCVFDDGTGTALYVGGAFTTAGGTSATHIARWNGSAWSSVGGGLDLGAFALIVHDDGSGPALFAGGNFTTAGGASASHVAKWDGTQWSALGLGVDGIVNTLASFDDGSGPVLVAGGLFTNAESQPADRVARWNGSSWSAMGAGFNDAVNALAVLDDGGGAVLYAGGKFRIDFNHPEVPSKMARWNGSAWIQTGPQTFWSEVDAMTVFDGGGGPRLVAGGGGDYGNVGVWDGTDWAALAEGPFGGQAAYATFDDGSGPALYMAGTFTAIGTIHANSIAKRSGTGWAPLGIGMKGINGGNAAVRSLCIYDDGSGAALYAGGGITSAGGVPLNNLARWDGTSWSDVGGGVTLYNLGLSVSAMAVFDDGTGPALFVGGNFLKAGGITVNNIAKWDGSSWSSLGTGTAGGSNFGVEALTVFDDGTGLALYAGGGFATADGVTVNYVAKWNGSVWSPLGTGMDGRVFALQVFDDGTGPALFAGGYFVTAGGTSVRHIAKWNGSTWSALPFGMNFDVFSLAVYDDGTGLGPALYAGGDYSSVGVSSVHYLARWNGDVWTQIADPSLTGSVQDLGVGVLDPGPGAGADLFADGQFTRAGGHSSSGIAQWKGCGRPGVSLCFGDGTGAACPCANYGAARRGCQNSAGTGGALLATAGWTSLANDSLLLTSSYELPSVLSIFLQGSTEVSPILFGDGLRCAGGTLKRMYAKSASGGIASAPTGSDLPVSHRSAAMGSPIAPFEDRIYQVYYRDPHSAFCPDPPGKNWNVSNAIRVQWLP